MITCEHYRSGFIRIISYSGPGCHSPVVPKRKIFLLKGIIFWIFRASSLWRTCMQCTVKNWYANSKKPDEWEKKDLERGMKSLFWEEPASHLTNVLHAKNCSALRTAWRSMFADPTAVIVLMPVTSVQRHLVMLSVWVNTELYILKRRVSPVNSVERASRGLPPYPPIYWSTVTPGHIPVSIVERDSIRNLIWRSTPIYTPVRDCFYFNHLKICQISMWKSTKLVLMGVKWTPIISLVVILVWLGKLFAHPLIIVMNILFNTLWKMILGGCICTDTLLQKRFPLYKSLFYISFLRALILLAV